MRKISLAVIVLCVFALLGGCSNRGWYEGFQGSARKECAKDREPCPDAPSYDRYKQEKEKLKK